MSAKANKFKVPILLVILILAALPMYFIGYKHKYFFMLPGIMFLLLVPVTIKCLFDAGCELVSRGWSKTTGCLKSARISKSYSPMGKHFAGNLSSTFNYSITAEYEYFVAGRQYNGTSVYVMNKEYGSWKEADRVRRLLQKDNQVTVYYSSRNPSRSCILHLSTRDIVISVGVMLAFSSLAFAFCIIFFYFMP